MNPDIKAEITNGQISPDDLETLKGLLASGKLNPAEKTALEKVFSKAVIDLTQEQPPATVAAFVADTHSEIQGAREASESPEELLKNDLLKAMNGLATKVEGSNSIQELVRHLDEFPRILTFSTPLSRSEVHTICQNISEPETVQEGTFRGWGALYYKKDLSRTDVMLLTPDGVINKLDEYTGGMSWDACRKNYDYSSSPTFVIQCGDGLFYIARFNFRWHYWVEKKNHEKYQIFTQKIINGQEEVLSENHKKNFNKNEKGYTNVNGDINAYLEKLKADIGSEKTNFQRQNEAKSGYIYVNIPTGIKIFLPLIMKNFPELPLEKKGDVKMCANIMFFCRDDLVTMQIYIQDGQMQCFSGTPKYPFYREIIRS